VQLLELSLTKYREFLNPYHHTVLSVLRAIASELRQVCARRRVGTRPCDCNASMPPCFRLLYASMRIPAGFPRRLARRRRRRRGTRRSPSCRRLAPGGEVNCAHPVYFLRDSLYKHTGAREYGFNATELQETLDAASKKLEERWKKAAEPPKRVWMD
jgi:hypothetical protein